MTIAIIMADSAGTVVYWSPGATELFGYEKDDVLGKSLDVIVPETYRVAHWAGFNRVMNGGQASLEGACAHIPVRCADNQVVTFPGRFSLIRDPYGQVIAAVASCADSDGDWPAFSPVADATRQSQQSEVSTQSGREPSDTGVGSN